MLIVNQNEDNDRNPRKESMTVQIKNREQLYDEGFTVRNAKPFWGKESHILGREPLIFDENIDSKKNNKWNRSTSLHLISCSDRK